MSWYPVIAAGARILLKMVTVQDRTKHLLLSP